MNFFMSSEMILLVSFSTMIIKECCHLICGGFTSVFCTTNACSFFFLLKTDSTEKQLETVNDLCL